MFSINPSHINKSNKLNFNKKKEYSMFISINANEEKLDDRLFYYYPNNTFEIDKFKIYPENPSFYLDFYSKNISNYERLSNSVKLLIAVNSQITKYNTATGTIVKINDGTKHKKCILTSFSLIKRLDLVIDEDLSKTEIYMISNSQNLYQFLKKMDFLISLISPIDKINFFEAIKKEHNMTPLEKDINILKKRSEFVKSLESSEYDYLFRDPITDKIILPALDVMILNTYVESNLIENDYSLSFQENFIEIDLDSLESKKDCAYDTNKEDNFLTYITHHIPRQKIDNILGRKKKNDNGKSCEHSLNYKKSMNDSNIGSTSINYEEIRSLEFSRSCCVLYDRSVNFGKFEKSIDAGLKVGYYSFNANSAGTLLLNPEFKAVGIAFFGSFDYYPLAESKKLYNIFLPLYHLGVIYILKSFLYSKEDTIKLEDFLKEKNINLIKSSDQIKKKYPKVRQISKLNESVLDEVQEKK